MLTNRRSEQKTACRKRLTAESGFALIELSVAIIIMVVLVTVFLDRIRFYQEQAEKTAMTQVARVIQSALIMQYGEILLRGKPGDLVALSRDNPMNWLQKKPHNYSGEFFDPSLAEVKQGNWLFDLKSRELIYVVNNHEYFNSTQNGARWIRFHVALNDQLAHRSSLQLSPTDITGISFEPVQAYSWL